MNLLKSKTNESNKFIYQFTDKLNLKNPNKNMALPNLSTYYTWKNIKYEYNNKFNISTPTSNDEFNLPDGSYSVSNIQDYFEYIIKKHETIADNPLVQIYVNKIKKQDCLLYDGIFTFKISVLGLTHYTRIHRFRIFNDNYCIDISN